MTLSALVGELEEREVFTLLRRRRGVTQADLERECGLRQSRISGWENGRVDLPREKVTELWEVLGANAGERESDEAVA
jgi:transcriptional regulator with XRE-family HTH domain